MDSTTLETPVELLPPIARNLLLVMGLAFAVRCSVVTDAIGAEISPPEPLAKMSISDAVLLGVVEGVIKGKSLVHLAQDIVCCSIKDSPERNYAVSFQTSLCKF